MRQVIIRFWENKDPHGYCYQHLSLETEGHYFSLYPHFNFDQKSGKNFVFTETYPAKLIINKIRDTSMSPPNKTIRLTLKTQHIDKMIEKIFQESTLNWQAWEVSFSGGYNCASAILCLLKLGGFNFHKGNFADLLKGKKQLTKALLNLEVSDNISALYQLAEIANQELSPEIVKDIAQEMNHPNLGGYFSCCFSWCYTFSNRSDRSESSLDEEKALLAKNQH